MKIALNQAPKDGPWGGGNRFLNAIVSALRAQGHVVTHTLDPDIDIALMIETRARSPGVTFSMGAVLRHLAFVNPRTVVIQRVNECDERKGGEKFITHKLLRANYAADLTVFVGAWLIDLPAWREGTRDRYRVVLNGADTSVFHARGFTPWNGHGSIKLVTHHWGAHRFKGFDVYEAIDDRLSDPGFADRFSFTYVGNLPKRFQFKNVRYVAPLNGVPLADELRRHHAYLTASINEPGGNHQNEGALCGLPLVYRNSGCLPEYCEGFGVSFNDVGDVFSALDHLRADYTGLAQKMSAYPHTAERMTRDWVALFHDVLARRDALVAGRNVWRNPLMFLRNQIPV